MPFRDIAGHRSLLSLLAQSVTRGTTPATLLLAGPATAGLVKVLLLFTEEKPVFMPSDFMDAFKENYWKAYLLSACDAVLFYLTSVAVSFYASQESFGFLAALPISAVLFAALVALFANFYAMPMIVKLKLGFFSILRNSLLLALAEIKNNFITLFWCAVIVVPCVLLFPYTLLAIIPLVPALVSFIACFNCWPIILRRCVLQGSDGETGPAEQIFEDTDGRNSDERQ